MTNKQPDALRLADVLDAYHKRSEDKEAAAMLRTQHADLLRKDALLRQAMEALIPEASSHTVETKQTRAVAAIQRELLQ